MEGKYVLNVHPRKLEHIPSMSPIRCLKDLGSHIIVEGYKIPVNKMFFEVATHSPLPPLDKNAPKAVSEGGFKVEKKCTNFRPSKITCVEKREVLSKLFKLCRSRYELQDIIESSIGHVNNLLSNKIHLNDTDYKKVLKALEDKIKKNKTKL